MVKLETLDIAFERTDGTFRAGDRVRGAIIISTEEPVPIQRINVNIKGEARNGWVNKTSDKIYEGTEIYINETTSLITTLTEINPGRHSFNFMFALPVHLPPSFEGDFGRIRYLCHVTVSTANPNPRRSSVAFLQSTNSSGVTEFTCDRLLQVISNLNLMHYPLARHPVEAEDIVDYTCCCIPLGTATAIVKVPRNGYMPREDIIINAEIKNNSRRTLDLVQVTLVQYAKFTAWSRYEQAPDTKQVRQAISSLTRPGCHARRTLRYHNEVLQIPMVIPTYKGNVIEISYVLQFEAHPGIEIEIPITIGTISM